MKKSPSRHLECLSKTHGTQEEGSENGDAESTNISEELEEETDFSYFSSGYDESAQLTKCLFGSGGEPVSGKKRSRPKAEGSLPANKKRKLPNGKKGIHFEESAEDDDLLNFPGVQQMGERVMAPFSKKK